MAAGSDAWETLPTFRLVASQPGRGWDRELSLDLPTFLSSANSANAVEHIVRALEGLPARIQQDGNWMLSVPSVGSEGFPIHLSKSGPPVRVVFGSFEQEFDTLGAALPWVERALSNDYQLRTIYIGSRPREFRLEPYGAEHSSRPPLLGEDVLVGGYVVFTSSLFRASTTIIKRNGFAPGGRRTSR